MDKRKYPQFFDLQVWLQTPWMGFEMSWRIIGSAITVAAQEVPLTVLGLNTSWLGSLTVLQSQASTTGFNSTFKSETETWTLTDSAPTVRLNIFTFPFCFKYLAKNDLCSIQILLFLDKGNYGNQLD